MSLLPLPQRGWEGQLPLCQHPFSRCEFPPGLLLKISFVDHFIGEEGGWGSTVTGDLLEMQLLRPAPDLQNQILRFHQVSRGVAAMLKCEKSYC